MSVSRFFWDGASENGQVELSGEQAHHIHSVLRLRPGDSVILCDGRGCDYTAELVAANEKRIVLSLLSGVAHTCEPELRVSLYLAYSKGERMAYAVQKSVELGVSGIFLFESERCVSRHSESKAERLSRIAREACKQSGRGKLVDVSYIGALRDAFAHGVTQCGGRRDSAMLFCYEKSRVSIRTALEESLGVACVLCGPEGGFAESEALEASCAGWSEVSLGKRILRSETAPVTALSILMYHAHEI